MKDERIQLKCENGQPLFPILLITLIFTGAGLGMLSMPIRDFLKTGSFSKINPAYMALGAIGLFFAAMGMIFVFFLLKPARAYKATLINSKINENGGYSYTFMVFQNPAKESHINTQYICTSKERIDLFEGDDCILYLKEAVWAAKAVEKYTPGKKCAPYLAGPTMVPTFLGIGIMLGGFGLASLMNFIQNPSETISLVVAIILLFMTVEDFVCAFQFEKDSVIIPKPRTGRGPDVGPETLPPGMGDGDVFYIKQDTGMNLHRKVLIQNKYHETVTTLEYPVMGGIERILKDRNGNSYGTYTFQYTSMTPSATFSLNGYEDFTIRSKMTFARVNTMLDVDYECRGPVTTIDSRILDVDGNLVATISLERNEDSLLEWFITKVTMAPGCQNNIYILMLALYTFEDYHARKDNH